MTQTAYVTMHMKMWHMGSLTNATKLADISTFTSTSSLNGQLNRSLIDVTLKSRKMVNHHWLVVIKLLIDFFMLKHGKLEEP